jgi:SlyX protein
MFGLYFRHLLSDPNRQCMNDQRLIELETKLAFQEDTLQQLHSVICEQQKQIDRLELTCKLLKERLKEVETAGGNDPGRQEIPPHY